MEKPPVFVLLGEFIPHESPGLAFPICIPCWTEEEVERAEKAAKELSEVFVKETEGGG